MKNYEFLYQLIKDSVKGSIQGLEYMEKEQGGLTMHGNGMMDAFRDVLENMERWEKVYDK